jgi:hypothetical protein
MRGLFRRLRARFTQQPMPSIPGGIERLAELERILDHASRPLTPDRVARAPPITGTDANTALQSNERMEFPGDRFCLWS